MDTAHTSWRPLGEVIVERGLVTQDQLEDALLEQRITHKRLGTILVDRGYVSAQELTDALVDQIGVEDLLDEFERAEESNGESRGPRFSVGLGSGVRRLRMRMRGVEMPEAKTLATPFSRIGEKTPDLGRLLPLRRGDETEPVERLDAADRQPEPGAAPRPPHAWIGDLRSALDEAETDLADFSAEIAARTQELAGLRAELEDSESALAAETTAHRLAEEEIARLHSAIDDRDVGLTQLEGTIEELRAERARIESELTGVRAQHNQTGRELVQARQQVTERDATVTELQATLKDLEQRSRRLSELEARAADLSESLAATDETLKVEVKAREQAQSDAKRLQDTVDEHEARAAKLARRVESLEAELQVVVAEREQMQRKLGSRERRVTKLEATLDERRAEEDADHAESAPEPGEKPEAAPTPEPEAATAPEEPETADGPSVAIGEAKTPVAVESTGFLYFVPRRGGGYELVEHDGEPPETEAFVELEGEEYEVTRHGRSPLAFDRRTCVYLRISG